jgi:hypothetical protein
MCEKRKKNISTLANALPLPLLPKFALPLLPFMFPLSAPLRGTLFLPAPFKRTLPATFLRLSPRFLLNILSLQRPKHSARKSSLTSRACIPLHNGIMTQCSLFLLQRNFNKPSNTALLVVPRGRMASLLNYIGVRAASSRTKTQKQLTVTCDQTFLWIP